MSAYDPPPGALRDLVATALAEDFGLLGDITSIACIADDVFGEATFVARQEGVLAGTAAAAEVYRQVDPTTSLAWRSYDGDALAPGDVIGTVAGGMQSILGGERVALNFLQHCSGVASLTRRYVRAARGSARILDTRKTLPGLRAVQKAAVRAGGGFNHRDSLSAAVLIKDNHLAALGITKSVERARARWPGRIIEVECDTLEQVTEARDARPDVVLVDNMTPEQVKEAVAILGGIAAVEVSGGVTLDSVGAYSESGADFISAGALTHSARALDIALDVVM
ncbi:MAG: nicotinate-nucleotide pyrophosphorylase (carboxylating) [Actinomycetia bacterium]|jgi:nicotinate-nucleotide pyrophosphorylase (carboxylating)|nr:nicotinate-nucleotide pyrophosphorylase (carboxylating) [Actinomycetes bacterium]